MQETVWARDPTEGYVLAKTVEFMTDSVEICPVNSKSSRTLPLREIFPAYLDDNKDYDDNCEMIYLNEGSLLNNIRLRYNRNKIYSYVANILIAVNPYKEIADLYSLNTLKSYRGKSLGEKPPHVFAIADKAFRDMRVLKESQSIIVSGESGAGKTESTKHLLKYLCEMSAQAGPIEQKILDANPVLEAFGNAKTTRNNNSSRFGKFIEVHFDNKFQVTGGHISHYLLEKSRISSSQGEERNYHIFYLLMAGAPEKLRQQLGLTKPDDFNYLKHCCTRYFTSTKSEKQLHSNQKSNSHSKEGPLRDILLDDIEDFKNLDQSLTRIGLNDEKRKEIYKTVAAVLHLGNIEFEEDPEDKRGGCRVIPSKKNSLDMASKLLEIDPMDLRQALESRVMQSSRGGIKGTVIMIPLKIYEANNARDALAKAIYSNLFDHIVSCINQSIPFQASRYYVGVLDIAGFEYFTINSFEQFCINYCNEKLQQFFNERILKYEQELYKREGLSLPEIIFTDNQDCIDLIETKNKGILNLLDEESKLPKPDYCHFTSEVHKNWSNQFRLGLPRSSKLKAHRSLRDDEGFLIKHFAGAVCYQTKHFIDKNNDALHASLEMIIQESKNKFIQSLFATSIAQKGKLNFISVGNQFKMQLGELMDKLRSNGTNFIRCIKPNNKMAEKSFDGILCLTQLECSGMISVLELMEHGYPSRTPFADLHAMYKEYLPKGLRELSPRTFCEAILNSLNLRDKDYKFGITRVFFRPGKFAEFDKIMKSDPENLKGIVNTVRLWLIKSRWLKLRFCVRSVIRIRDRILFRRSALITVQKHVRGYLVKKHHGPRIKTLLKLRALDTKFKDIESMAQHLKTDKDVITNSINNLKDERLSAIARIKRDDKISASMASELYDNIITKIEKQMQILIKKRQEQKIADEQERLRKIQEELERQKKMKEEEEKRLKEEEQTRKLKAEMEAKRKIEEEALRKQEEAERKATLELKAKQEKEAQEELQYQKQLEQERRDHELALRLAQESNGQIEDTPPLMRNGGVDNVRQSSRLNRSEPPANKGKYDLSKWKYSELRDTINTSCDIDLLEACRHEFHRRLKVYHAWKAKNHKRSVMEENERAPRSIMESANKMPKIAQKVNQNDNNKQRYFRIPFTPTAHDQSKRGFWFAHFDGQYVARQMELHSEKPPVLLVAGKDDMQMCELSLEETGLTRKRGAEIVESEFEKEWLKNGGTKYVRPADRK